MENYPEVASTRPKRQWWLLLTLCVIVSAVIFIVFRNIKPVSLQHQASLAAPVVNLSWVLLEPELTDHSKIYRTSSTFLDQPDPSALIATVPAPTTTYQDTNVTTGSSYYYSIFLFDQAGNAFDPSYFVLSASDSSSSSGGGGGGGGSSDGGTTLPPSQVALSELDNFKCSDSATVYVYYKGQKEVYPEPAVYFAWNQYFTGLIEVSASQCATIPGNSWVRLPEGSLVKIAQVPTVWLIEGTTARPIASLAALSRLQVYSKIITISLGYLHTYSGGAIIN